jgi:hypothetical protein
MRRSQRGQVAPLIAITLGAAGFLCVVLARFGVAATDRATAATDWPSSRFITRTPVASRPCEEMLRTSIRVATPADEMQMMSSSSPTMNAATT